MVSLTAIGPVQRRFVSSEDLHGVLLPVLIRFFEDHVEHIYLLTCAHSHPLVLSSLVGVTRAAFDKVHLQEHAIWVVK